MSQNDEDMWLIECDPVVHILSKLFLRKPAPVQLMSNQAQEQNNCYSV